MSGVKGGQKGGEGGGDERRGEGGGEVREERKKDKMKGGPRKKGRGERWLKDKEGKDLSLVPIDMTSYTCMCRCSQTNKTYSSVHNQMGKEGLSSFCNAIGQNTITSVVCKYILKVNTI